jgi:hypothetical protein
MTITPEELQILCDTTVNLVELRQRNCPHLSVETVAPEIMRDLFAALLRAKESGALDAVGSPIYYAEHAAYQAAKMVQVAETVGAAVNRHLSDE